MRQLAIIVSWVVIAAACGATTPPSVTRSATGESPRITVSPTVVVFARGRVELGDDYFAPDEINVTVGATVTWQIASGENNHDVVSSDGVFRSNSPMTRGVDMFTFTFTKPGEYRYVCSYHIPQGMVGKVIVK
jgi:plastocyanin